MMTRARTLVFLVVTSAVSCFAQSPVDGGLLLPFIRKVGALFHPAARELDSNGLPTFQPAIVMQRDKVRGEPSKPSNTAGTVTLSSQQYTALWDLVGQEAQANTDNANAAPTRQAAVTQAVYANPQPVGDTPSTPVPLPVLQIPFPATPAVTRPQKSQAVSANSPPLRRKQQ